jgi:plastocyanin
MSQGAKMKMKLLVILTLATLLLAACGTAAAPKATQIQPTSAPPAGSSGDEVQIKISGFKFDPASITIKAGTKVTWTNEDSTTHNVAADDGGWRSPDMGNGAKFSRMFDTAGTYPYNCGFHPGMKGTIIVEP